MEDSADFFAIAGDDKDKMSELLYLDDISFLPGSEASEFDINGANIYRNVVYQKYGTLLKDEFTNGLVREYD